MARARSSLPARRVRTAADRIIARGKRIAAHLLEAAAEDIEFAAGRFRIAGTDRSLGFAEIARASVTPGALPPGEEGGLIAAAVRAPADATFPNGCHVCEAEVDPETGQVRILRYVIADDVGRVINPLLMKGQLHGGVAQGLGQALLEQVVFEEGSGQLLSASFHGLRYAARGGSAPHRDPRQPPPHLRQSAGSQGGRRSRHRRRPAGGGVGGDGRPLSPRHPACGHAADTLAHLASDPHRQGIMLRPP